MSFHNEYDGHTIEASLKQVERLTGRKIKVLAGDRDFGGKAGNKRDEDNDTRCSKEIRQQIPKAQETQTFLQTCRHRANHRTLEVRLPFTSQLLQRRDGRCCEYTSCSCSLQFQKSHESSFVSKKRNQRDIVFLQYLVEVEFLRDDYLYLTLIAISCPHPQSLSPDESKSGRASGLV